MIQSNEIRIGVTGMYNGEFITFEERDIEMWVMSKDSLQEIPLTPEMLFEQLGFVGKYKSCGYVFNNGQYELTSQDTDDDGNSLDDYIFHVYYNHSGKPFYFLHELQNFHLVRTGEELPLKHTNE